MAKTSIQVSFTLDLPKTFAKGKRELRAAKGRALKRAGLEVARQVRKRAGIDLTRRSGKLERSWGPQAVKVFQSRSALGDAFVRIGSTSPYANIHEEGGTIRPKKAKWLTIPLTAQARRAGSPRRFSGQLFPWVSPKSGERFLAAVMGKGRRQRLRVHYLLRKRVEIPARRYVTKAVDEASTQLDQIWQGEIRAAVEKIATDPVRNTSI